MQPINSYLTADIEGVGGTFKESPETFLVEEVPLYTPCGEGEHLYLWIEKRGISTHELINRLSRACKIKEREISYAGLKDAKAVTRQYISIPARMVPNPDSIQLEDVTILSAERHKNKLRMGHLRGNRFVIRVDGIEPGSQDRIGTILDRIRSCGMPNLFGEQRYGVLGNSHLIGGALLRKDLNGAIAHIIGEPNRIKNDAWRQAAECFHRGDYAEAARIMPRRNRVESQILSSLTEGASPEKIIDRVPMKLMKLYLNAWQSHLFDQLVAERIAGLNRLQEGDIACKHINGAVFRVEDLAAEQQRADTFEISATAPLFGRKVMLAEAAVGEQERTVLDGEGLSLEQLSYSKRLDLSGERRPIRVPVTELNAEFSEQTPDSVTLSFQLPKGSYATSLLREVIKPLVV